MAIKNGDTLRVHYTGTLSDGTVFDSSRERDPLEFTMGKGMLIPGFEAAVMGHEAGETVTVTIPPSQAYGESDPELVFTVDRAQVPDHIPLTVGVPLQLSNEQGQMDVTITEVTDEEITLEEAVYILKRDTRHFAKRQLTWFRREKDVRWLDLDQYQGNADLILADILKDCEQAEIVLK